MKNLISIVFFICSMITLFAQGDPMMTELDKTQGTNYKDFDISKIISTSQDFDQEKLNSSQIDSVISKIIAQQIDKPLAQIEFPINSKKLVYLGRIHPTKTNLFYEDFKYFLNNDQSLKGDLAYIYKYENLYISTKSNTLLDRYLVYYSIRSFLLIKNKLPYIYEILFEKTDKLPVNFINKKANVSYINLTKNYFITFDGFNPLPENNPYFGSQEVYYHEPIYGVGIYPNIEVMYFNKKTIRNGGAVGIIPIYNNVEKESDKFHRYMKDGFIHSFVHEKIHDWIFQYNNLNDLANFIRFKCQADNLVSEKDRKTLEEQIVNNTTNILFEMGENNNGLSDEVLLFYQKDFEVGLEKLKKLKSYEKLKAALNKFYSENNNYKLSKSYKTSFENKIFFLDLTKEENIPN